VRERRSKLTWTMQKLSWKSTSASTCHRKTGSPNVGETLLCDINQFRRG
jgi:hypothetical protein